MLRLCIPSDKDTTQSIEYLALLFDDACYFENQKLLKAELVKQKLAFIEFHLPYRCAVLTCPSMFNKIISADQRNGQEGTMLPVFDRLARFFSRRPVYHTIGWLGFLFILVLAQMKTNQMNLGMALVNEAVNIIFYAALLYFNLNYLFPQYLRKGQYFLYLGLLLLATLVLTPIKLLLKYLILDQTSNTLLDNFGAYFFSTFLVGSLATVGKMMTDWFRQNRERQELVTETMQSELRFLKSQINPHFLFNTLNSLYALTLKKSDAAPDIVIKLSEMMRYMLYECNEKTVPLSKEVAYIRNYLDLEKLRQQKDVKIDLEVTGKPGNQQVAPLMFMNFLENSFKHGLNSAIHQGFVNIRLQVGDREVVFHIENSKGSLMPQAPEAVRPSGGIGLVNVRRRLELLYPDRHELSIRETPNAFAVTLKLQL